MAKSATERKRDQRTRNKAGGKILKEIAVYPETWEAVEKYIAKANKRVDSDRHQKLR